VSPRCARLPSVCGALPRYQEINGRFVENTVQQLRLFSIATLALCTVLTPTVIPAAVIVFVIALVVFWIAYRVRPV
jgi:hypothetical protein